MVKGIAALPKYKNLKIEMNWYKIISGTMTENKANNYEGRHWEKSEQSVKGKRVGTEETIERQSRSV